MTAVIKSVRYSDRRRLWPPVFVCPEIGTKRKSREGTRGSARPEFCLRSGFVGQRGRVITLLGWRIDDFHLLPVVRKFLSAIQTSHIGTSQFRRSIAVRAGPN